ncbi:MAG: hypothetical protein JSV93_01205, partial [Candidatus Omnitrophota bacterium]
MKRIILLTISILFCFTQITYAELHTNMSADVVVGQADFTSNSINQTGSTTVAGANTLYASQSAFSDGKRLFIADQYNNRVLIYNSIPTSNN